MESASGRTEDVWCGARCYVICRSACTGLVGFSGVSVIGPNCHVFWRLSVPCPATAVWCTIPTQLRTCVDFCCIRSANAWAFDLCSAIMRRDQKSHWLAARAVSCMLPYQSIYICISLEIHFLSRTHIRARHQANLRFYIQLDRVCLLLRTCLDPLVRQCMHERRPIKTCADDVPCMQCVYI